MCSHGPHPVRCTRRLRFDRGEARLIFFGSRDGGASEASRLHGGPGCSSGSKDADCACVAGQQRPCYTGPTGTLGVGACKAGVQTCVATQEAQFAYGPCEGETLPSATNGGCIAAGRPDATVHVDAGKPDVTVHVDAWTPPDAAVDGAYPVLFGGVGNVALSDTWVWNGSAWSEVAATGPGGGDGRANTVMAPLGGQLVLFGGWDYGGGSGADFGHLDLERRRMEPARRDGTIGATGRGDGSAWRRARPVRRLHRQRRRRPGTPGRRTARSGLSSTSRDRARALWP